MFLAGGFVLGEAWILCGRAVSEEIAKTVKISKMIGNMGAVEKTGRFVIAGVAVAVVVAIVAVLVLMSGNELSNWFSDRFGSPLSVEKYRKRQRERIEERKGKNRQGRFWPFSYRGFVG